MTKMLRVAALAVIAAAWVGAAQASTLDFTVAGKGTTASPDVSFDLSSNPSVVDATSGSFTIDNVEGTLNGAAFDFAYVSFFTTADGGGFTTPPFNVNYTSAKQLFSGSTSDPTFSTGTVALTDDYSVKKETLTVSTVSSAPEPATWALMFAGVGLIGATLRKRRNVGAFA
jgi:hypothetical protein